MIPIQDVFLQFYHKYEQRYTPNSQQFKAVHDIMRCRTPSLGGHLYSCFECGHTTVLYNSCRNRHCPCCQNLPKTVWVDARSRDILNAPYFHVVFTVPAQLQRVIYQNQDLLYNLLYKAVAETLTELSQDPKYLGAQIGFMSILHTWAQDMTYHPHIHTVVLAGGLTENNDWQQSSKKFFLPVKVLSKRFRRKFMDYLKHYNKEGLLKFYGNLQEYQNPQIFANLVDSCYKENWYTYTKKTFSGPQAVIRYLGMYTHRVAISKERVLSMDEQKVTIRVKDRQNGNKPKTVTMDGEEFIRRFLMHVLPKGFVKVRYYGLLSNRNKKTKLERCRLLTESPTIIPTFEGLKASEILKILLGKDVTLCPCCRQRKLFDIKISPAAGSP